MSDPRPGDGEAKRPGPSGGAAPSEDAALEARLGRLGRSLDERASRPASGAAPVSARDTKGWAQAMRLSSEFIAGILVGGGVGFGLDWAFGWSPFGLIVFVMLGFAAGVLNVLRSMGEISGPGGDRRHRPGDRNKTD